VGLTECSNENTDFNRQEIIAGGMLMVVDLTTSYATEFMEKVK